MFVQKSVLKFGWLLQFFLPSLMRLAAERGYAKGQALELSLGTAPDNKQNNRGSNIEPKWSTHIEPK